MILLTPKEVAELLKVPVGTIYYWSNRNEIPYMKVGRHLRFDKRKILEHFAGGSGSDSRTCFAPCSVLTEEAWSVKTNKEVLAETTKE